MKATLKARMAIMRQVKQAIRHPYAWPGGYQLSIIMNDGMAICPKCAEKEYRQVCHDTIKAWRTGWDAAGVEILWEGGNYCDHCSELLDAYPHEEEVK